MSPVMIVAALVLLAVGVGVFVLTNDGDGGLDAAGAAAGLEAIVDDADFDPTGRDDLRRCPLGDVADIADELADDLDLPDEVLDADDRAAVDDADGSRYPATVWCELREVLPPGASVVGRVFAISAGELPRGDWDDYVEDLGGAADIEFADEEDFRGGVIYSYCGEGTTGAVTCGADWVDEDADVAIGLYHTSDDDDPQPAVEALKQRLPELIESLADEA